MEGEKRKSKIGRVISFKVLKPRGKIGRIVSFRLKGKSEVGSEGKGQPKSS